MGWDSDKNQKGVRLVDNHPGETIQKTGEGETPPGKKETDSYGGCQQVTISQNSSSS